MQTYHFYFFTVTNNVRHNVRVAFSFISNEEGIGVQLVSIGAIDNSDVRAGAISNYNKGVTDLLYVGLLLSGVVGHDISIPIFSH